MQQTNNALRDQKAKILAEAYDLLMLSPEAFMSVYYVNNAGQKMFLTNQIIKHII